MFEHPTKINADIKALLPDLKLPGEYARRGALGSARCLLLRKFADLEKETTQDLVNFLQRYDVVGACRERLQASKIPDQRVG